MALLRSHDMEGYLRVAQSTGKESRLRELLSNTDSCLRQLSTRLAAMSGKALKRPGQENQRPQEALPSGGKSPHKALGPYLTKSYAVQV